MFIVYCKSIPYYGEQKYIFFILQKKTHTLKLSPNPLMIIGYRPVKKKTLKTVHFASLQTRHTKNAHIYVALVVAELFELSFSCSERGIEPLNNRHQRRPSLQKNVFISNSYVSLYSWFFSLFDA